MGREIKRFSIVLMVFLSIFISFTCYGEVITWQKTYGGSNSDVATSIYQTTDGGYIVAGWTKSFGAGDDDFYIIKLDANGNKLWEKTYGGNEIDMAYSIQQTSDGGYVAAGYTYSFGTGGSDFYVLKLDAAGNKVWGKTYGGSEVDEAYSIQQTTDGGYIVAGDTGSFGAGKVDFYILKLDKNGNKIWEKTYGGGDADVATSIYQTTDGGYIVAGWTKSFGAIDHDFYILKLDANGDRVWEKMYGGVGSDSAASIQQTTDGGYIVAGYTNSFSAGEGDFYIIKLNNSGDKIWEKNYGGGNNENAASLQQTTDGGYIVAGYTNSFGAGDYDGYVIKLDSSGNKVWEETYGGSDIDYAHSIYQTVDGGYIIAGVTSSFGVGSYDFYVIKTDAFGNVILPLPKITQISPTSGYVGTEVTIKGYNFGPTQDTNKVTFAGIPAPVISWSDNEIRCIVPVGAESIVKVIVAGQESNKVWFAVEKPPPDITSIIPTSSKNSDVTQLVNITIYGANFQDKATVRLTSPELPTIYAKYTNFINQNELVATFDLKDSRRGIYNVIVINPDAKTDILPAAFEIKDGINPKAEAVYPGPNAIINDNTPTISARVKDDEYGVGVNPATVKMYLDGVITNAVYDEQTGELSTTVEEPFSDGSHTVRIEAFDYEGNEVVGASSYEYSFCVDATPPDAITDLTLTDVTACSIKLRWTAPNLNDPECAIITGARYDIRMSTVSTITDENWDTATRIALKPVSGAAGTQEVYIKGSLPPETTFYFAIKTIDEASNTSLVSNSPSERTLPEPPRVKSTLPPNNSKYHTINKDEIRIERIIDFFYGKVVVPFFLFY